MEKSKKSKRKPSAKTAIEGFSKAIMDLRKLDYFTKEEEESLKKVKEKCVNRYINENFG